MGGGGGPDGFAPPPFSFSLKKSFTPLFAKAAGPTLSPAQILPTLSYKGEPSVKISKEAMAAMSKPLQLSLIGKFSHGRPTMERSRPLFSKLGLSGGYDLGHLDQKHMLIRLQKEDDFNRLWLRDTWYLDGYPMRMFKWSPDFRLEWESPIVPVWISLPNLPLFLFNKSGLFSIGSLLSKPLTLDSATADMSRPSVARVCVEIDLLKTIIPRVRLDCESGEGFWQEVIYEKMPSYCNTCKRLGHDHSTCMLGHPELAKKSVPKPSIPQQERPISTKAAPYQRRKTQYV